MHTAEGRERFSAGPDGEAENCSILFTLLQNLI